MSPKKMRITRLKKEIEVKDYIIGQLLKVITEHKIKLPEILFKNIRLLYNLNTKGEKEKCQKKEKE